MHAKVSWLPPSPQGLALVATDNLVLPWQPAIRPRILSDSPPQYLRWKARIAYNVDNTKYIALDELYKTYISAVSSSL